VARFLQPLLYHANLFLNGTGGIAGEREMTKLGMLTLSALLGTILASGDAFAHKRHASILSDQRDHYRGYLHGYVDGYRRAQALYFTHARKHVRRKVVRLAPGPNYYYGQIDPWWRGHLDD
jgi:hypothetical protein